MDIQNLMQLYICNLYQHGVDEVGSESCVKKNSFHFSENIIYVSLTLFSVSKKSIILTQLYEGDLKKNLHFLRSRFQEY